MARGMPLASVSRLLLVPPLPRSVGLGPVFFPAQRGFGHRTIHRQPVPVDALEVVILQQARFPERFKHARIAPFGKAAVG